jgi:hypothetical protein
MPAGQVAGLLQDIVQVVWVAVTQLGQAVGEEFKKQDLVSV